MEKMPQKEPSSELRGDIERASAEVTKDVNVRANSLLIRLAVLVDRNGEGFSEDERRMFLDEIHSVCVELQKMPVVQLYDTLADAMEHSGNF